MPKASHLHTGIIGGSGYTGQEMLRLLLCHPHIDIAMVCSRSLAGQPLADHLPHLRGRLDLAFADVDIQQLCQLDLVISAAPNGVAMQHVPQLLDAGVRVIDMSADFRLQDARLWEYWYSQPHLCPQLLNQAAYGLSEWNAPAIAAARLVANPGCYATAMQLALLPLADQTDWLELDTIMVDGKSGISGAGNAPSLDKLFAQLDGNLLPYKIAGHRHLPEVLQQLRQHNPQLGLTFVPHLIPMSRGMLITAFIPLRKSGFDATSLLRQAYTGQPFVDVLEHGVAPQTKSVVGTNMCRISATVQGDSLVLCSAIDNLGKGAAGQAVQNINLMYGWEQTLGLHQVALYP